MVEVTQVAALQGHLYFGGRPFPCGILSVSFACHCPLLQYVTRRPTVVWS